MEQNNFVRFRFEEYYDNNGIKELTPVSGVIGKLTVAVNYISDGMEVTAAESVKELTTRVPIRSKYLIADSTGDLFGVTFESDSNGYIDTDLTKLLINPTFLKFYNKYAGKITLSLTIATQKNENYNIIVSNFKINTEFFKDDEGGMYFKFYDYYNNDDTIILQPIQDINTDITRLKQSYKTIEETYLLIKKQYETQISGEIELDMDTEEDYHPTNFKVVITRLLELQEGTLKQAIDYTKTTGLKTEYDWITAIDKLVTTLSSMYPNVTIDDGEGIPYINRNGLIKEL
jgi:hypothetical protein